MTDEIKKAMGCCADISCSECDLDECKAKQLPKGVVNLINRLQTKNKELDEKLLITRGAVDWQAKEINRQKAEIEKLTNERNFYKAPSGFLAKEVAQIKAETMKEFIEWLQKNGHINFSLEKRLSLVKEMAGD